MIPARYSQYLNTDIRHITLTKKDNNTHFMNTSLKLSDQSGLLLPSTPASFLQSRWRNRKLSSPLLFVQSYKRHDVRLRSIFFISILVLVTPVCVFMCRYVRVYVHICFFNGSLNVVWWHVKLISTTPRTRSVQLLTGTHSSHTKYTNLTTQCVCVCLCMCFFMCVLHWCLCGWFCVDTAITWFCGL